MNIFKIQGNGSQEDSSGTVIKLRCPGCRQKGTFDPLNVRDVRIAGFQTNNSNYIVGIRRCPDLTCGALVFFISDLVTRELLASLPAERIDFDATDLPAAVRSALEQAITCHANDCLIAAAIMVRKTLEELCSDRQATGKNLKEKIKDLGNKIVLPQELLQGLDDLRLLGNDAAHIESQVFDQIGKNEVEIGIEFAKEVLKATYQYSALLSKLRALKKSASPQN
jgi:hypothetical protein